MNVPNEELDSLRALAGRLQGLINGVYGQRFTPQGGELLQEAGRLAAQLTTRLDRAGAAPPQVVAPSRYEVPLHLLDTPANRHYADALRVAWEAGMAVDRERYGKDIGTDGCAQILEMVLADVEQEIGGAVGRLRE